MFKYIMGLVILLAPVLAFSQRAKLYDDLPIKAYYKNGNLRVERNFKDGNLSGYKTFYKNGDLQSNFVFNSKGYHDSIANFYYPNGQVKTVWNYKKGIVKKRIDYTLDGELVKGNIKLKKIRECNAHLPFSKSYLTWTYRRGKLNSQLGFSDQALEDFNYILSEIDPKFIRESAEKGIYQSLAIAYTYIEDYEKAMLYNLKALDIEPNNQAVLNNLGWLFIRVKEYDLALEFLDRCHKINPKNYYAFFNKAIIYLDKGNYKKALSLIEKTIADKRSHEMSKKANAYERTIWVTRGELYHKLGRTEEGIKDLQKALDENPFNSYAHRCLAIIYRDNNQLDKACNALVKATEYKYDKVYDTDEIKKLLNENCSSN